MYTSWGYYECLWDHRRYISTKTRPKKNKCPCLFKYHLEQFVVGNHNQLRYSLCEQLLHDLGLCHNPLSMSNQAIKRLYNDRGQLTHQYYDAIVSFSTFLAFSKLLIRILNRISFNPPTCRVKAHKTHHTRAGVAIWLAWHVAWHRWLGCSVVPQVEPWGACRWRSGPI
jgi:hypothetical protein